MRSLRKSGTLLTSLVMLQMMLKSNWGLKMLLSKLEFVLGPNWRLRMTLKSSWGLKMMEMSKQNSLGKLPVTALESVTDFSGRMPSTG